MRKAIWATIALVVAVSMVLAACGPTPVPPTKAPEPAALKVGLVTDVGKVNDGTFNEFAYKGMMRAVDEFKLKSAFIETLAPTDYEKNISQFAEEKYDVIITVGFMIGDATAAMAKKYPNIKFAIVDFAYDPPIPNVMGLVFTEDQSGYLAGALAGLMTKSNVIGIVCGKEIPPVVKFRKGYENGAKSVNPNVKVLGVYIDSFTAPDKGKEAALSQIAEKADVIFGAGGPTGSGGIKAAAEKGVWVIGVDQDEYFTTFRDKKPGYDKLISSAMKRVDVAVYTAIANAVKGTFKGGTAVFDATNDGVGLAPFHDAEKNIPKAVQDKLAEIAKGMKEGKITTGVKL
ncbi:MAG: BMP family ABC transporter substrate-binding protein [Chloroflexi bacterium]|nr:BMP family ABC transporter substrate-binding protein [Chloroflexota bacterium]